MTTGEFHKMHGLGNDFVIIDTRMHAVEMSPARARQIADRKTGIGCDQVILLMPTTKADLAMRIFNPDGSEVEACGNASRCVVALLDKDLEIETKGGVISGRLAGNDVSIDMGAPKFGWDNIPLAFAMDSDSMPIGWEDLENPMAVNIGNPHAIFFVADAKTVDLPRLGPMIENDPVFPERVNVNIASIKANQIDLRVWERSKRNYRRLRDWCMCDSGCCHPAGHGPVPVNRPSIRRRIADCLGAGPASDHDRQRDPRLYRPG